MSSIKTFSIVEIHNRTGQNMHSAILVFDGLLKIYREDDQRNEFFMYYRMQARLALFRWCVGLGEKQTD
jgi:CRP/FNR family transcriptional regulator